MMTANSANYPYQDDKLPITARVSDLLSRMTLEEKTAQLCAVWLERPHKSPSTAELASGLEAASEDQAGLRFDGDKGPFDPEAAAEVFVHGIGHISRQREYKLPGASVAYANDVQRWLRDHTRLGIPAILHDECLHGHMATGGTHYPQPLALAATWNPGLIERIFQAIALEVRSRGGHQVLGPNLDVGREPRWGRVEETYGEDPYLCSEMGKAAIFGLQGRGETIGRDHVLATGKHFAGYGLPEGGTNCAPIFLGERTLREVVFPPFQSAVRDCKLRSIMPSYNEIEGIPSHANKWLLKNILRDEWGFSGTVVADYGGVVQLIRLHAITDTLEEAARLALESGVDIELASSECYAHLPGLIREGKVAVEVLDQAVARILHHKFELGLFDHPFVSEERAHTVVQCQEHRQLALEAARQSIVLLKNANQTLPLDRHRLKSIAVVGPNAAEVHLGGYSDDPLQGVSVLQGIQNHLGDTVQVHCAKGCYITKGEVSWWTDTTSDNIPSEEEDWQLIDEAVACAEKSDVVVAVIGGNEDISQESWSETHTGDRDSVELFGRQNLLVQALLKTGKPVIVLLIHSGPLAIPEIAAQVPAILDGFYMGQEGGTAVAEILFGEVNPQGKLPICYPRSTGQLPVYYGIKPTAKRNYLLTDKSPLFAFGHGLSYTSFAYGMPKAEVLQGGETKVRVTVEVTNTGERAGTEVVQCYLRDVVSSITRPVKELAAFTRVELQPGESQTVTLDLPEERFKFWNQAMEFVIEPGRFEIMVGPNSVDLQTVEISL